jgi:hypothetical protein
MNNKLIKLLVSACIGLCVIVAVEWLYASYMQYRLLTSISSAKLEDYKADELPDIDLTKQPEESYADLVARPLFIKGRRAVAEQPPETAQVAVAPVNFDWQLTGIYSTEKNLSALFSRSKSKLAKDNYRKITLDNDLDGWKLTKIDKDRVLLKQGDNEKELLLRKSKLKGALPPRTNNASQVAPAAPVPVPAAIPEPAAETIEDTTGITNEDTTEETPEGNQ